MVVSLDRVSEWMAFLREHPQERERFLECFWPSQLQSKEWLLRALRTERYPQIIHIFGGWYGVFAQLVAEEFPSTEIFSVDIDPKCEVLGRQLCRNQSNIMFETANMAKYRYARVSPPQIVINCSTEHITQDVYDEWWEYIPKGTHFYMQGNDLFDCPEHVRCSHTLEQFINQCRLLSHPSFHAAQMQADNLTRFMVHGVK